MWSFKFGHLKLVRFGTFTYFMTDWMDWKTSYIFALVPCQTWPWKNLSTFWPFIQMESLNLKIDSIYGRNLYILLTYLAVQYTLTDNLSKRQPSSTINILTILFKMKNKVYLYHTDWKHFLYTPSYSRTVVSKARKIYGN